MNNTIPDNKDRGNIIEIIMRYENGDLLVKGDEAKKWIDHCNSLAVNASLRAFNQNPFDKDPVKMQWIDKA